VEDAPLGGIGFAEGGDEVGILASVPALYGRQAAAIPLPAVKEGLEQGVRERLTLLQVVVRLPPEQADQLGEFPSSSGASPLVR
jgi:hypothetical protein